MKPSVAARAEPTVALIERLTGIFPAVQPLVNILHVLVLRQNTIVPSVTMCGDTVA